MSAAGPPQGHRCEQGAAQQRSSRLLAPMTADNSMQSCRADTSEAVRPLGETARSDARGDLTTTHGAPVARETLPRHTLVWIARSSRPEVIAASTDAQVRDTVGRWLDRGLPLIVRRRDAASQAHDVALGLPLPPAQGKQRIALRATSAAIAQRSDPPRLGEIIDRLPAVWRSVLSELAGDAAKCDIAWRVVGSALWEALTGIPYLHQDSDIDLVWRVANPVEIVRACECLAQWERRHSRRADGEILFPDGGAVAWREWSGTPRDARVLVKRVDGVALEHKRNLALSFVAPAQPCMA